MTALISIAVIAPLLGAGISLALRNHPKRRDIAVLAGLGLPAASSHALLATVAADGTHTVAVGGWAPELGIVLVADMFAALMLPIALTTIFVVEIFAIGQRKARWGADAALSGPLMCVLTSGVSLAFLTGDLFTLFIAFELILVSSYVLLTHQGTAGQVRSGMTYVVMNLLASTLFLFGVAFVYSATGTVNLALLAERIPQLSDGVRLGIGTWFLVVFGTKAAVFPLFSWLPDSYPTAPTTITAVFAGLLTKIGIYAMIRFHTLTGMDDLGSVMLMVAAITMIVGGLGALAQSDIKRILSFHVISQIGYMLMGLGLFSVAGTAAAILFLIHIMPVKAVLFLLGGLIENNEGSSSLDRSGGLAARKPLIAVMFAVPALSLAGIPPFSGFLAKLAVVSAAIDASATVVVVAGLLAGALTLLSMWKIWNAVFWSKPVADPSPGPAVRNGIKTMHTATALGVIATLIVSLLAGPLLDLSTQAAEDLHDRTVYIEAVRS